MVLKFGKADCYNLNKSPFPKFVIGWAVSVRARISDMGTVFMNFNQCKLLIKMSFYEGAPLYNPEVKKLIGVGSFTMFREDFEPINGNVYMSVLYNRDWIRANLCDNCG